MKPLLKQLIPILLFSSIYHQSDILKVCDSLAEHDKKVGYDVGAKIKARLDDKQFAPYENKFNDSEVKSKITAIEIGNSQKINFKVEIFDYQQTKNDDQNKLVENFVLDTMHKYGYFAQSELKDVLAKLMCFYDETNVYFLKWDTQRLGNLKNEPESFRIEGYEKYLALIQRAYQTQIGKEKGFFLQFDDVMFGYKKKDGLFVPNLSARQIILMPPDEETVSNIKKHVAYSLLKVIETSECKLVEGLPNCEVVQNYLKSQNDPNPEELIKLLKTPKPSPKPSPKPTNMNMMIPGDEDIQFEPMNPKNII